MAEEKRRTARAADDPAQVEATEAEAPKQYVRYIGTSDVRQFSEEDWRAAGILTSKRKTVTWGPANGKVVDMENLSFLSSDEFDRCIRSDPDFQILTEQ